MNKSVIVVFLSVALANCSPMDALSFIKPSSGISVDTEIVAGDKHQEVATGAVVGKKETTTNTAETITQTYNTIQQGKSIFDIFIMMLMAFLVGWLAMPSSRQMWMMIKKLPNKKPPQ